MKYGVMMFSTDYAIHPAELGRAAEERGFESLLFPEHTHIPSSRLSPWPGGPNLPKEYWHTNDVFVALSFAAAATSTIRIGTGICLVIEHDPITLAKQVATLDYMSNGRFELGIGVGWLKEEFEAVGVPFAKRGKRADEYVAAMRALWAADGASFAGEFVNFREVSCNPKPAGRVPIIVGGHTEAAARRAGRLGDGFFPSIGSSVDPMPLYDVARRAAAEAGRDPGEIELFAGCPDLLPGSTVEPQAAVEERARRGVNRIVVPVGPFLPSLEESLMRFGETVIRPFAGA